MEALLLLAILLLVACAPHPQPPPRGIQSSECLPDLEPLSDEAAMRHLLPWKEDV